jgi:hypothetical protein
VVVPRHGIEEIWAVEPDDCWDYDVAAGMGVYVMIKSRRCRIVSRAAQNKKFVKIGK